MIKIPVTVKITKGTLPADYVWSSDDPDNVTFSKKASTTTDGYISTQVIYSSQSVIDTATISLLIVTADGCDDTKTVAVSNLCDDMTLSAIINNAPFEFSITAASPGCPEVDFTWGYNDNIFELVSQSDSSFASTLKLKPKTGVSIPTGNTIEVSATNCNNCDKSAQINYTVCIPTATSKTIQLTDIGGTELRSAPLAFSDPTGCVGYTYDWSTLAATLPTGWRIEQIIQNNFYIYAPLTTTSGSYSGTYTVRTDTGIKSNPGNLSFSVFGTDEAEDIIVADKVYNLACSDNSGDVIEINIEDEVSSTVGIDWSSWKLVSSLGTPKSTSIVLGTNTSGDHVVKYTVPNPVENDVFHWSICNTSGDCSDAVTYTVTECINAPTATDDATTVTCGDSVNIDILANDLGNGSDLKKNSVVITEGPSLGTVIKEADGTVTYQSEFNSLGSVTFKYKVMNTAGEYSNEATVTVTIDCAGTSAEITICN